MTSSDSGRFSAGKSNFNQTCNRLSQYMKEKGGFGELSLGLEQPKAPAVSAAATAATMDLFPTKSNLGFRNGNMPLNVLPQKVSDLNGTRFESETAQMTIFYAGQVIVFNDFPAGKAKEIMSLASKSSSSQTPQKQQSNNLLFGLQSPAESSVTSSDLPIARKNSLARFLEKRKDRITSNGPYQKSKCTPLPAPPAPEEQWLRLAPQMMMQNQYQEQ